MTPIQGTPEQVRAVAAIRDAYAGHRAAGTLTWISRPSRSRQCVTPAASPVTSRCGQSDDANTPLGDHHEPEPSRATSCAGKGNPDHTSRTEPVKGDTSGVVAMFLIIAAVAACATQKCETCPTHPSEFEVSVCIDDAFTNCHNWTHTNSTSSI